MTDRNTITSKALDEWMKKGAKKKNLRDFFQPTPLHPRTFPLLAFPRSMNSYLTRSASSPVRMALPLYKLVSLSPPTKQSILSLDTFPS